MSININNFNFIAAGGSQSISVTSNGIWTVSGLPAWLRANPATDFGNATTSIIATVNPNLGSRSCVITISSWSAMAFVTITQDGTLPLLVANPSILNYLSAASSQTLSITSNINWTISGLPVWLSVNTSSGFGNRNISLSTQLHSIVGIRTALITITGGALTQFVNITQTGAAANLVANPLTLTYPSAGNSQNISVTSNINWTIVSSQLWLTLSNPNGTNDGIISATASSNTATGIRIAQVTISGGSLTQIVNITQTGANPNVNVNSSTVNFTAAGGVQFVTISSNSNWNVSGIPTWMTVNPTNGTGNFVITLTAPINLNVNALNGIITVTSGLSSVEININQNGATPLLLANPLTLTYPSAGNSQNISVTSNINWTISGLPNWITLSTISGFGDKIVAANAVLNTSTGIRIAQLTVAGGAISRIINITQSGANPVLVANPLTLTYPSAGNSQNISVTSNMNWTSISSQPWLTLSNPNGTNDGIILASASFNLSTNNRIATVTVTSLNPIVNQIISITQTGSMPAPILAINKANITNCGGTGSITLTGSGGALPYEFSLDNFVNTSTSANASFVFSNLAAGTYTGYVRNSVSPFYGTSISGILITTPVTPNIVTITASDITNCGLVDGAINVQANQGTGILEYFIDNSWTTSSNANGLAAGLYQVSVRNQNSPACSVSGIGNININQPNTPSNLTVNQINSIQSCDGSLGNIVLSATFGMQADLRFSLDGVDWTNATGTFTGLAAGSNYKASVRNVNAIACSLAGNNFNTITTPSFPSISLVTKTDITDCGLTNGAVTISGTGGTGNLEYSIDNTNWQNANIFSNLSTISGFPKVRNVLSQNCLATFTGFTITTPSFPSISSVTKTDITDCGLTNGAVTILGTGGTGTLEYSINNIDWQNGNVFAGLSTLSGFPKVRNVSSQNCVATFTGFTITTPSFPNISATNKTDITDCGLTNGAVTISGTGGTGNLEYSIDNTNWQNANIFSNLSTLLGFPKVRNVLSQNCLATFTGFTITTPSFPSISLVTKTDITDCGLTNGAVTISGTGGTGNLEYSIDNTNWQNANIFSNLSTLLGFPKVRNVLSQNCVVTFTGFTITTPSFPSISSVTKTDITDCGLTNGAVTILGTGGTGNLEYSLNGTVWQLSNAFINLSATSILPKVRNQNSIACSLSGVAVMITAPSAPILSVSNTQQYCVGLSAVLTASGANNFAWTPTSNLSTTTGSITTANPTSTVIYTVTGTNGNCSTSKEVQVVVDAKPATQMLTYNNGGLYCSNNINGYNPVGWNLTGGTFAGITNIDKNRGGFNSPSERGNITITYTTAPNGMCPSTTVSAVITITQFLGNPSISYGNTKYCKESDVVFPTLTGVSGLFSGTYTSNNRLSINQNGTIDIKKSALGVHEISYNINPYSGCTNTPSTFATITIVAPSIGNISASTTSKSICVGNSVVLSVSSFTGDAIAWKYIVNNIDTEELGTVNGRNFTIANITLAGTRQYKAMVSMSGCNSVETSNAITIAVDKPTTFTGIAAKESEICDYESTEITLQGIEANQFTWYISKDSITFNKIVPTPLEPNSSATTDALTTPKIPLGNYGEVRYYKAEIKNGECPAVLTPVVKVVKCKIDNFVPNAFVPDANDGKAVWDLSKMQLLNQSTVNVFNRNGVVVFSQNGGYFRANKWNGDGLPAGTYYYVIDRNDGINNEPIRGDLTIMR